MIEIYLNNKKQIIETSLNLHDFLKILTLDETGFAVAINQTFIPRSDYQKTFLQNNDQIILLQPMQGG